MKDFLNAAFPWIAGGIGIAIILTYGNSKKKPQDNKE
jgi:predicted ferric reductase